MRRMVAGLVTVAVLASVPNPVAGQAPPGPVAGCAVAPRTVGEVVAAAERGRPSAPAGTPAVPVSPAVSPAAPAAVPPPSAATPAASPTDVEPAGPGRPLEIVLPAGAPAPPAAVAAMRATMEQYVACATVGDVLRLLALMTDDYIVATFRPAALTEENVAAYAAEPRPVPPEQRRRLVALRQPRLLPDGRLAALVDLAAVAGPVPGAIRTDFVVFAKEDGTLRIDAYTAGLPPERFGPE